MHFNRRHSTLQGLSQIRITRSDRKEFQFLIRGKNAPAKVSFKLPKLQPEQNQSDMPPQKSDSQFITEGLEFEYDEGENNPQNPPRSAGAREPEDLLVPSAQTALRPQTGSGNDMTSFHEVVLNAPTDAADDGGDDSHENFERDPVGNRAPPGAAGNKIKCKHEVAAGAALSPCTHGPVL